MKTIKYPIILIGLLLIFSVACSLIANSPPSTPTNVNNEYVGGQIRPSKTLESPESTVEPIQPPLSPTVTTPASVTEDMTASNVVEQIRPCSLITSEEAERILGEKTTSPREINGACAYNNSRDSLYVISVTAAQEENTIDILQGQAMLLGLAGVPIDQTMLDHLRSLATKQEYIAYFTELENLAQNTPSVKARILKGTPDLEYWVWLEVDKLRQSALVVVRNQTAININLIVPDSHLEPATLEALQDEAEEIYRRLPQHFSIILPSTSTPTEIVIASPWIQTFTSTPWEPTFTPTLLSSIPTAAPIYVEQPSYSGDCTQRPKNSICLSFEDGYIWLIYSDSITGWDKIGTYQGRIVQVAFGIHADYYHVLGTSLIMTKNKQ